MQCFNCQNIYNSTNYSPRLLIQCGHSLCESCTISLFKECLIICPECKTYNYAPSPQSFPKNLALLSVNRVQENEQQDSQDNSINSNNNNKNNVSMDNNLAGMCLKHNKPIEAFCENDKQLLCITCILEDGHRKHEISSISNAAQNERNILNEAYKVCKILEDKIYDQLKQLEDARIDAERQDINNRHQIKQFFSELHKFLNERENLINSKYKSVMNNFTEITNALSTDKKKQLSSISQYYKEYMNSYFAVNEDKDKNSFGSSDLKLLKGCPERIALILEATKEITELDINSNIEKFNQDGEVNLIIKHFQMYKSMPNSSNNNANQNLGKQSIQSNGSQVQQCKKKNQQSQLVQQQQQIQIQTGQIGNYFNKKKGPIKNKSKVTTKEANKSTKLCERSPINLQSQTVIENNYKLKRGPSYKALHAIDQNVEFQSKTPAKKNMEQLLDLSSIHQEKYQLLSPPSSFKQDMSQFLITSMQAAPLDFSMIYQQQINSNQESIFLFGGDNDNNSINKSKGFEIEVYDDIEILKYFYESPIQFYLPVLQKSSKKIRLVPSDISFNLNTMQFEKEKFQQKFISHSANNPTCLAFDNSNLIITGGTLNINTLNLQQSSNACTLLSLITNETTNLSQMNYHRSNHAVTLGIDNKIYAIGGIGKQSYGSRGNALLSENKEMYLNSVEVYDLETKLWQLITPMKTKRAKHSVVTLPDAIYVFGGFDGENYLNSVEKYDFITKEWSFVSAMKEQRCSFSTVVNNDFSTVYALGGVCNNNVLSTVEKFNVQANLWTSANPLKTKKSHHQALMISQRFFNFFNFNSIKVIKIQKLIYP